MKFKMSVLVLVVLIFSFSIAIFIVNADIDEARSVCEEGLGGTYVIQGNVQYCYNMTDPGPLGDGGCSDYVTGSSSPPGNIVPPSNLICGFISFGDQSLKGQGRCKFSEVQSGFLGDMIKVSGMGAPAILRLQSGDITFKLPVVEGSIEQNADGTFTASYSTIDPATGQPLVKPGSFKADCFGSNGPAGQQFDITISR